MAMMKFILESCQQVKLYATEKMVQGEHRGSTKGREGIVSEWVSGYIRLNRIAEDVPRYSLRNAVEDILDGGTSVPLERRNSYRIFVVDPRIGWKKQTDFGTELNWEDYLEGRTTPKEDHRTVKPDTATYNLFEEGLVSFKWGRILLKGKFTEVIDRQCQVKGIDRMNFLREVKDIQFARIGSTDRWKVNFNIQ